MGRRLLAPIGLLAAGCSLTALDSLSGGAPPASEDGGASVTGDDDAGPADDAASSVDPELVAWWKLDENAGFVASDSSGNELHANLNSGASWIAGKSGSAVSFDGLTGVAHAAHKPILETVTSTMTVATWIYVDSIATSSPGSQPRVLRYDGTWYIKLNGGSPQLADGASRNATFEARLPTGTWRHFAFTFDRGTVVGYLDGIPTQLATDLFAGAIDRLPTGTSGVLLGGINDPDSQCHCRLDDVRIYRRVLAAGEIAELAR